MLARPIGPTLMNAVAHMISRLPPAVIRRLAAARPARFSAGAGAGPDAGSGAGPGAGPEAPRASLDIDEAAARLLARWGGDLCGLLNALARDELDGLASELRVTAPVAAGERAPAL